MTWGLGKGLNVNGRRIDWDAEDIKRNFDITDEVMNEYDVVYSADTSEPYETSLWAVLRKKATGELFEINCGTCSCYGCEGQFQPTPTTLEAIKNDMDHAEWSAVCDFLL